MNYNLRLKFGQNLEKTLGQPWDRFRSNLGQILWKLCATSGQPHDLGKVLGKVCDFGQSLGKFELTSGKVQAKFGESLGKFRLTSGKVWAKFGLTSGTSGKVQAKFRQVRASSGCSGKLGQSSGKFGQTLGKFGLTSGKVRASSGKLRESSGKVRADFGQSSG